jgi:hypothetical protein
MRAMCATSSFVGSRSSWIGAVATGGMPPELRGDASGGSSLGAAVGAVVDDPKLVAGAGAAVAACVEVAPDKTGAGLRIERTTTNETSAITTIAPTARTGLNRAGFGRRVVMAPIVAHSRAAPGVVHHTVTMS